MPIPRHDLVVVGDINLDLSLREQLGFCFTDLDENGRISWGAIDELPGGTGLNFAVMAKAGGFVPLLIGCVGEDYAGTLLLEHLRENGIGCGVTVIPGEPTGKAMILRDARDIRLLNDNSPNANRCLSSGMLAAHADSIARAMWVYVSGYAIKDRSAPRFAAIEALMKRLELAPEVTLIWDLVPHKIYEGFSRAEYFRMIRRVDILVSEVSTMRRFLEMGDKREQVTREMAVETAEALRQSFRKFCLRWGPSGVDFELVWDGEEAHFFAHDHQAQPNQAKRGYGDRLLLRALKEVFLPREIGKSERRAEDGREAGSLVR